MANIEPIGIKRIEALHYYVHDLERSRRFYTEKLDFAEIAASSSGKRFNGCSVISAAASGS